MKWSWAGLVGGRWVVVEALLDGVVCMYVLYVCMDRCEGKIQDLFLWWNFE